MQLEKTRIFITDYLFFLLYLLCLSILSKIGSAFYGNAENRINQTVKKYKVPNQPCANREQCQCQLQKGGVPATPSGTATLLRLSPNHRFHPRPLLVGHGLQAPPAFMA